MATQLINVIFDQLDLDGIVRFKGGMSCGYQLGSEVLKLFDPRFVRSLGGRSADRRVDGYVGFVLRQEVPNLGSGSSIPKPNSLSLCPIANFPELVRFSAMDESRISPKFKLVLHRLLSTIPDTKRGIDAAFGEAFLQGAMFERVVPIANFIDQAAKALPW